MTGSFSRNIALRSYSSLDFETCINYANDRMRKRCKKKMSVLNSTFYPWWQLWWHLAINKTSVCSKLIQKRDIRKICGRCEYLRFQYKTVIKSFYTFVGMTVLGLTFKLCLEKISSMRYTTRQLNQLVQSTFFTSVFDIMESSLWWEFDWNEYFTQD